MADRFIKTLMQLTTLINYFNLKQTRKREVNLNDLYSRSLNELKNDLWKTLLFDSF